MKKMAYKYDPSIEVNIKALIVKLTHCQEDTDVFKHAHDGFTKTLSRENSAFCISKKEIDTKVAGLTEKLIFHGFLQESQAFKSFYEKFLSTSKSDDDMKSKMAIMQFLFALSRSPTNHLATLEESIITIEDEEKEEEIDWGNYLLEGIHEWKPNFNETDTSSDDDLSCESDEVDTLHETCSRLTIQEPILKVYPEANKVKFGSSYEALRVKLMQNAQHGWFVSDTVRDLPKTDDPEANIAIRWENYLSEISHGLLGGPRSTKILSEYKVLREILWQLFAPHNSVVFAWTDNTLTINDNVTIASLRSSVFKNLLTYFADEIMMLYELRTFQERVSNDTRAPHSYCGYAEAVKSIVRPAMKEIMKIEAEIAKQETTNTLISLGSRLGNTLKNIHYLQTIHHSVVLDYTVESPHNCSIHLLTSLYKLLSTVYEKEQMDIVLTLYFEAVYKYIRIIEEWFRTDRLTDSRREFPYALHGLAGVTDDDDDFNLYHRDRAIEKSIGKKARFEQAQYISRSVANPLFDEDPLMCLIRKDVLQISKQLRLFTLLGKLSLLHDFDFSIYDEWKSEVCGVLQEYADVCKDPEEDACEPGAFTEVENSEDKMVDGVLNLQGKYITEFDLLERFVDTSDGFLMLAFKDVFFPNESKEQKPVRLPTYLEVRQIGKRCLPGIQIQVAESLQGIIQRRFRNCGQILKDVFIKDYNLAEHLAIMSKIFLFHDDIIFPFYRSVFGKIEANANWGNDIWLTHDLQDVLSDAHPSLHEGVRVGVRPEWASILQDPLRTCTLIVVKYAIDWPIDIIVSEWDVKMYTEMFYVFLKLKWALHTLNHLQYFREKHRKRRDAPQSVRDLLKRLEMLRFGFINVFAALQHYLLGYVYRVGRERFDGEFEAAKDLESLIRSHHDFVHELHRHVARIRDYQAKKFGFDWALYSVRKLREWWLSPGHVYDTTLKKTEDSLKECHKNIFDVISVQVYD